MIWNWWLHRSIFSLFQFSKMSHQETCIFSSHLEANALSFQCFLALSDQESTILNCLKGHIFPHINEGICEVLERRENQEQFRVLSVGSGEVQNDINILKALADNSGHVDGQAVSMVNRVVEPHVGRRDKFRLKTENLHEHFERGANIDFEWIPLTYQKYKSQKNADDITFDLIHFTHSIYYVGVEEALIHCYEKELGKEGVIISIAQSENDPMLKFARKFPNQRSPSFPTIATSLISRTFLTARQSWEMICWISWPTKKMCGLKKTRKQSRRSWSFGKDSRMLTRMEEELSE